MSEQHRVPLSVWIASTSSLPDKRYLIPALRVACSLADQICKAEEAGQSPMPSSDWIDSIEVHENRRLSAALDDDSFDVENFLFGTEEECGDVVDRNKSSIRVEILPSLLNTTTADTRHMDRGMQRIHSLGVVFYEIFSRGGRPAALEPQKQAGEKPKGSQTETEEQEDLGNLDSLFFDEVVAPIDLDGVCGMNMYDDVSIPDENNVHEVISFGQNPAKKLCSVSMEPLKVKGIPWSLCDLISNMMDCDNGTVGGENAYQNMSQVRSDLQLMLVKPVIYLYDQDIAMFATTGLQRSETIFGRNAEFSTIMDAYRRSVSGDNESVTIFGPSGSGKTFLALKIGDYVVEEGGVFLYGKFDQLQQGKPFSALASAFDRFLDMMINNDIMNWMREQVACQVRSVLGQEAYHLTKIIPNLAIILGPEPPDFNNDENCVNAQQRLQYLLCRFVEVISISAGAFVTVTLCLDDLQWADSASIAAVKQLLLIGGTSYQNTPFFFMGCYREGEVGNSNPLWKVICDADLLDGNSTNVKLDYMDEETVNTLVSETLCLLPRLTRALSSIIYRKTKGNPLFVSRLMLSLSKEGLLRPSLSRRRWEWDEEKIRCKKLPDDVAMFLTNSVGALPEDVRSALCVLSCFGGSAESAFINVLEGIFHRNLLDKFDVAIAEGLLDKINDQYSFSHDRIQAAAYNMMVQDRCLSHFQYGMALAPLCNGNGVDNGILFTAANQLNLGGPEAVQYDGQIVIAASLNLRAGKKAIDMSDFITAYSYFEKGITFLRKKSWHWTEHYELSLELFNLAAKCALFKGDIASLTNFSQQVMDNTRSFEDQLNVSYFSMYALASSKVKISIEMGRRVLEKLGIDLRGYDSNMEACLQDTKYFLSELTDGEIMNMRQMTDPKMIMAMKFLGKLQGGMSQIMPESVPSVSQKIIQLSLSHGLSPLSPTGFVYFGSFIAKLGDISGGYHYVRLALSLLDKVGSRESAAEVICIGTQVRTYVEPIQAALEYHNDGYAAAMVSGDINMATMNKILFCGCSLFACLNLQTMREKIVETQEMMAERKQDIHFIQMQPLKRSVFMLVGIGEETKAKHVLQEQNFHATNKSVLRSFCFHKVYISFLFRCHDDAKKYAEKYFDCCETVWASLFFLHASQSFYIGLTSFWLARKSREEQQLWYHRGNQSKEALKKWAESSLWTFENKWYLLEAEESYCNNDFEAAKSFYKKAVSSAKNHKVR